MVIRERYGEMGTDGSRSRIAASHWGLGCGPTARTRVGRFFLLLHIHRVRTGDRTDVVPVISYPEQIS